MRPMIEYYKPINDKRYTPFEIAGITEAAKTSPAELVRHSEEYYQQQVDAAMLRVKKNMPNYKFVLLCGPSASGKTTTAHKLKQRLIENGVGARVVSMDNFYLGIEHYPLLPNGKPDMESIRGLDLDLLNKCFDELLETGESMLPIFDFAAQEQRLGAHHVALGKNDVLIMEGIHALNPEVLENIPRENVMRIYASVRTKFVHGDEVVLIPKDIRLMRRMVRDQKFRNYPPLSTLGNWEHVLDGERQNINPYRDDVDIKMDNTIDYEVCVWHSLLQSMLDSPERAEYEKYPEIIRILEGLMRFPPIDYHLIPEDSLLREFLG